MKLQKLLSVGLKELGIQKDTSIAIALSLRTEKQLITMINWILKNKDRLPSEDEVLSICKKISPYMR